MTLPTDARAMWSTLNRHRDELQRINSFCWRANGTTSYVRFEPSRSTAYVQVHVQSAATGGATYNAATYVSSTEVDCRDPDTFIYDQTVTRDGVNRFWVWLIPVYKDPATGTTVKFDGSDGDDYMAFIDLGV